MDDRTLLELAARAAGMEGMRYSAVFGMVQMIDPTKPETTGSIGHGWNPLADDGDALRLAVKLGRGINFSHTHVGTDKRTGKYIMRKYVYADKYYDNSAGVWYPLDEYYEDEDTKLAATRRAIVRAAAEIGRTMKEGGK